MRLIAVFLVFVLLCGCVGNPPDNTKANTMKMNEIVVFETNKGNFEVELYRDKAPITVENFLTYVQEGHYDGTVFHRVIDGFMIQGGGFTPEGVQKQTHAPIKLESDNGLSNVNGTIAMARTMVEDSATCQFFINVDNNTYLDHSPKNAGYAVFGRVVSGMDVVIEISKADTTDKGNYQDWPKEDILIEKTYVKK